MSTGSSLESLVLASQGHGIALTKVPSSVRYIRGGKTIPVKGPVDFLGVIHGRAIAFDAKECQSATSFAASTDHFPEHQRLELLRWKDAQAISGLLILCTATDDLYWLDAERLQPRKASYRWDGMDCVGTAKRTINWRRIVRPGVAEIRELLLERCAAGQAQGGKR